MTAPLDPESLTEDHPAAVPGGADRRRFLAGGAIVAAAAATAAVGMALPQPAGAVLSTATSFYPLSIPKRVYDSRPGNLPNIGPKAKLVGALANLSMSANGSGVPASGIAGVMVSLTVTSTSPVPGSYLAIYRNGIVYPGTSCLNWFGANQTLAVTTFSAVDAASKVTLFASSTTDVIVDVLGYYA